MNNNLDDCTRVADNFKAGAGITPYLELEQLRDNRLSKTKMYSWDEVQSIVKEWDEQAKSKLIELEDMYSKTIERLNKRVKELKKCQVENPK